MLIAYPMNESIKTCNRCGELKAFAEFYRNRNMPDGHLNQCKVCVRPLRREQAKVVRGRKAEQLRRWKQRNRAKYLAGKVEWKRRFREQNLAHKAVNRAISAGVLTRPETCERCSAGGVIHGHHEDYSKQLEVVWLCIDCHAAAHRLDAAS